jgi:hypothetical protein
VEIVIDLGVIRTGFSTLITLRKVEENAKQLLLAEQVLTPESYQHFP